MNAALLAEEEAEALRQAESEKEKEKELQKSVSKDKKSKKGAGRKSRSPSRSHMQETPIPAATDDSSNTQNEEEKQKKMLLEKAHKEYKGAIFSEGNGLRIRLELIKVQSIAVVQDLKAKAEQSYKDMNDWLGERFLQEMDSIDCLAKAVREAIENEEKLQTGFTLKDKDFVVDLDVKTYKTPSPPPPPSPKEPALPDTFTVVQLLELYRQIWKPEGEVTMVFGDVSVLKFLDLAPSGLIAVKAFCDTFLDLASCTVGSESLPDNWMSVTVQQLQEICNVLSADQEYVDWRSFLVAIAKPWTPAKHQDLLDALDMFRSVDQLGTGVVNRNEYEEVRLWLLEPIRAPADVDADESSAYNRTEELYKILFDIFADVSEGFEHVDYVNMLLYFCIAQHPLDGFLRALSVVTGKPMPAKEELDFKLQEFEENLPIMKNQVSPQELLTEISINHLLKVFNHGKRFVGDDNCFSTTPDPVNLFSEERLAAIYAELGATDEETIPLYLLYQHPVMRDYIEMCEKYKDVDIRSLVKAPEIPSSDQQGT